MSIFIRKDGEDAERLDATAFDKEDTLQEYIHDHPETIPLYDLKDDLHLLVLAREFNTNSGPIDALAVDADGDLYIIETKLETNPDKRRVVSQALDYGAALWQHVNSFSNFKEELNRHAQKSWSQSLTDKLQDFFEIDDEALEQLFSTMRSNLNDGIFKIVVMMDNTDQRLRDIILYVNQNSQFDIYAIDFSYYKKDDYEIVIPKLYGAEVKKDISVSSSSTKHTWTPESIQSYAKENLTTTEFEAFMQMYQFTQDNADKIRAGSGSYASFSGIYDRIGSASAYTVSADDKVRLSINFKWIADEDERIAKELKSELADLGFDFGADYKNTRPSLQGSEWIPKVDVIASMFQDALVK